MNRDKKFLDTIVNGIQEKKGQDIVVADLTAIDDTICNYFIVCQGNSPSQVKAIADSVDIFAKRIGEDLIGIDGFNNAEWIAMDFANVIVHIFLPEFREFYDIENLWEDAKLTEIPNLD